MGSSAGGRGGCCFPQPGGRGAERPPLLGRAVLTHGQGLQRRRGWRRGEGTLRLSGAEKSRSQAEPAGGSAVGANGGPLQRGEPPAAGAGWRGHPLPPSQRTGGTIDPHEPPPGGKSSLLPSPCFCLPWLKQGFQPL